MLEIEYQTVAQITASTNQLLSKLVGDDLRTIALFLKHKSNSVNIFNLDIAGVPAIHRCSLQPGLAKVKFPGPGVG